MDDRKAEVEATRKAVAAELRARRAYRHITQAELIKLSGISQSAIERLETGKRDMDIAQLVTLARALGFDPAEFMTSVQKALDAKDDQGKP